MHKVKKLTNKSITKSSKYTRKAALVNKQSNIILPQSHNIMKKVDDSKLIEKIKQCNIINSGTKDGIGNESENININQTKWNLYKIKIPDSEQFKLLGTNIEYYIIHTKLRKNGRPLIVIPGYSDKSICWSMGEMNRYILTMPKCFVKFSDIYVFNLENVKVIQEANKDKRDKMDNEIAIHIDRILRSLQLKNISLLGRSAGGGICIHIARISAQTDNDYVNALNLASPGYKRDGIMDFINARMSKPIPIRICWAIEDITTKIQEGYQMKQQLIDSKYITQGPNLLKFVEISTNTSIAAINHRVHKELIYMLE